MRERRDGLAAVAARDDRVAMTRKLLSPSRLLCHHEAALQRRMGDFVACGDIEAARRLRVVLAAVSELRARAAASEASGAFLN